jgi:hypothetical protein
MDIARRPRDVWIVDFTGLSQEQASFYALPYSHVVKNVKPLRDTNNDRQRRTRWWLFGRSGADFRERIAPLTRCIVTPEVSKHRIFAWLPRPVLPDCQLMVIAIAPAIVNRAEIGASPKSRPARRVPSRCCRIRTLFEQEGELSAAIELRRLFPGITDNAPA